MQLTVIGTGYVGLVVGAGLAHSGNDVICADIDPGKIARLSEGVIPIHEPGLGPLVRENLAQGRLRFTTDAGEAVRGSELLFIAVGTPADEDGSADVRHVLDVAGTIGRAMNGEKIVVTKSTVPVGTAARVRETIEALTPHRVHVCSNPEFLQEGAALRGFMEPDRVVIGTEEPKVAEILRELHVPFVRTGADILVMDVASAELTKYAANAMLATRVSLMNSVARLSEAVGADVEMVRRGVGLDRRIGASFLFPGIGYGGSCLPKDVQALIRSARSRGVELPILEAVEETNEAQKRWILERVVERFGEGLAGRRFALWGLAFKPNTDDMREAPSLVTIEGLLRRGARVSVHDPVAIPEARRILGPAVEYFETNYAALDGAAALLIHTEWHPYRHPDFARIGSALGGRVIIDGRNLYAPDRMKRLGFEYDSVGRRSVRGEAMSEPRAAAAGWSAHDPPAPSSPGWSASPGGPGPRSGDEVGEP